MSFANFHLLQSLSTKQRLTLACTGILASCIVLLGGMMYLQWQSAAQKQANALGQTLVAQTAIQAEPALFAEDTVSLNNLLQQLLGSRYVSYAAIYSPRNSVIVQAGKRPASSDNIHTQPLTFQRVLGGTLQIHIDIKELQEPVYKSMQSMLLLALLIMVGALFLLNRLAGSIYRPVEQLRQWMQDPQGDAPGSERHDELGQLAQAAQALMTPPVLHHRAEQEQEPKQEEVEETDETSEAASASTNLHLDIMELPEGLISHQPKTGIEDIKPQENRPTPVLAVQLKLDTRLGVLSSHRLAQLWDTYYRILQQAATEYSAKPVRLEDGRTLLLFTADTENPVRSALFCGELLRALGHRLQADTADSGVGVTLQLGLSASEAVELLEDAEFLLEQPAVQAALELNSYSHNLLLISHELAADPSAQAYARMRSTVRPESANCVEQLLPPYPARLEYQLNRLLNQQQANS